VCQFWTQYEWMSILYHVWKGGLVGWQALCVRTGLGWGEYANCAKVRSCPSEWNHATDTSPDISMRGTIR
jgi:hypothetical protein